MTLHSLPLFVRLEGRPVILIGAGDAADAKRRLLERAGATIVGEDANAQLAIVVDDEPAVARLKARGVLVNAVDRPELCDFTLPAIVDRSPVILAIGTGGASAGLAAALRQRLETLLPAKLGSLATRLHAMRAAIRERFPDLDARRRALGAALSPGGALDPLIASGESDVSSWLSADDPGSDRVAAWSITTGDPDSLTLGQARDLALADRIYHHPDVPASILDRARADAVRIACDAPPATMPAGLSLVIGIAR